MRNILSKYLKNYNTLKTNCNTLPNIKIKPEKVISILDFFKYDKRFWDKPGLFK